MQGILRFSMLGLAILFAVRRLATYLLANKKIKAVEELKTSINLIKARIKNHKKKKGGEYHDIDIKEDSQG